jgi:hypothetical protein
VRNDASSHQQVVFASANQPDIFVLSYLAMLSHDAERGRGSYKPFAQEFVHSQTLLAL